MRQLFRGLAVLSSFVLLLGFVYYRTQKPLESGLNRETVLPSSKVGAAVEVYSTDWSGKYPTTTAASPIEDYQLFLPSSKSARLVPERPKPASTTAPLPSESPEQE